MPEFWNGAHGKHHDDLAAAQECGFQLHALCRLNIKLQSYLVASQQRASPSHYSHFSTNATRTSLQSCSLLTYEERGSFLKNSCDSDTKRFYDIMSLSPSHTCHLPLSFFHDVSIEKLHHYTRVVFSPITIVFPRVETSGSASYK